METSDADDFVVNFMHLHGASKTGLGSSTESAVHLLQP